MAEPSSGSREIPTDEIVKARESPLVLCPLGFERRAFLRFGKLPVVTTGPGADAIRRAFAHRERWPVRDPSLVILLGLAGALDPALQPGRAAIVTHVVLDDGTLLASPLGGHAIADARADALHGAAEPVSITEVPEPVATPRRKAALRASTGARLVDTESLAFASCAAEAGLPWAIVRGVSDGAAECLPPDVTRLVDARGETSLLRLLGALAYRPLLAGDLVRLAGASRAAMRDASFLADALGALPGLALCSPERPLVLYGGSFDPPHLHHAAILAGAMRALRAPCAIVMPAQVNPLKREAPPAPAEARLAMCRAAFGEAEVAASGEVRLSRIELDRGGPSYTIETVESLLARMPHLAGAIRLLVGSDAIRSIGQWSRWRELLSIARPAVVVRPPDAPHDVARFLAEFAARTGFADAPTWLLDLPPVDLSSTDVRTAIARGERPTGLADRVWREIASRGLYGFGGGR